MIEEKQAELDKWYETKRNLSGKRSQEKAKCYELFFPLRDPWESGALPEGGPLPVPTPPPYPPTPPNPPPRNARNKEEKLSPEGPARHLDTSQQKLTPHCLAAIFDSQLPSPKLSLKMPPKIASPPQERVFFLFQKLTPR